MLIKNKKMLAAKLLTTPVARHMGKTNGLPTACKASLYFKDFPNYCQMIRDAKSRARRSILIDHCGIEHIDLKSELNNIERVYTIEKETKRGITKLSLIEFNSEVDAESVAKQAKHNEGLLPVPLKIFQYNGKVCSKSSDQDLPFPVEQVTLSYKRELSPSLNSYSNFVSDCMMSLIGLKLRFITLVNLERILCSGMFEEYELMPFGSSVIDIGCDSGDLDLVVTRKEDHNQLIFNSLTQSKKSLRSEKPSQLIHLDKSLYSETRDNSGIRGAMRWFDHILREYMPLTDGHGVLFVSHAKVPIIRFTSRITSIDCDLSFNLGLDYRDRDILTTNYSGILMSEALYALCRKSNVIVAVVIYLRYFGKLSKITSKTAGIGFTNFQFFSLIIFYLQQISITSRSSKRPAKNQKDQPITEETSEKLEVVTANSSDHKALIPPFRSLLNSGIRIDEKSWLNLDDNQLNQVVPKLIMGFLEYYSNFDFNRNCLNLYDSKIDRKMDNSSIYVVNPMDRNKNICHNINRKSLENLTRQVGLASKVKNPLNLIENLSSCRYI